MADKKLKLFKVSADEVTLSFIAYVVSGLFALICVLPFIYVLVYSIIPYSEYLKNPFNLIPKNITFEAYKMAMDYKYLWTGYKNTIFIAIVGTICSLILLVLTAYPLAKRDLKGQKFIMTLWIITMFFSGGMIPNYLLIRSLGLLNNLWSVILPGLLGAYNLILMINYIRGLPTSIEEAALIEGANDIQVLFRIILPLCLPIIATLGLFTVVGYWNSYFDAIIYLTKREMWPLQLVLREIVFESAANEMELQGVEQRIIQPFTLKMASIIIATLPIMCVYPFLQKYFMAGLVLGGVKE
ncbi:carbohydrate ABC transporter permease [Caldicoprobacter faecalis]|uniref:Carbohydrate ABC transporter membrane protein 2, CUT1 family n=1 Tax=Caldicoprobacter faecalis TaxID=937334 RepID=A0A1I5X882_9FIRM|nr:carbohydrate ABC transporter permease [Caldicoprobacter faecalis]SFQ28199.1 carbohydrate ABC transporter membrane protein 2, CUT1 family [Caldicoprobacter faecalis]